MTLAHPPKVTFLLAVRNSAATVGQTLASILGQTFSDYELLIIDDASTDGTADLLERLASSFGGRMHVRRNDHHLELTASLARGMCEARGAYVARIDADDVCLPCRTARQVAFLDDHPDVAVVGSFIETFANPEMPGTVVKYPADRDAVAAAFLFRNPLAHPAVMIRRDSLRRLGLNYDPAYRRGQDYELWFRCLQARLPLANIPEVLTRYRVHPDQATRREEAGVRATSATVRRRLLHHLGIRMKEADSAIHEALSWDRLEASAEWLASAAAWLERIYLANRSSRFFHEAALGRTVCGRWVRVLEAAVRAGRPLDPSASPLACYLHPAAREALCPAAVPTRHRDVP